MADYDLYSLKCAHEVFKTKSLTKAAKVLNISKVAVSKRLAALESELGVSLFVRTTRVVQPTPEAQKIFDNIRFVLEKLETLNEDVSKAPEQGNIRISANSSIAHLFLAEELGKYQKKNPLVNIELIVTDSILDLTEQNIDLTIRINPAQNSSLVGKKIGEYRLHFVASPKYLKAHPAITSVRQIANHNFIALDQHFNRGMGKDPGLFNELEQKRVFKTNDSSLVAKFLVNGQGIGLRSNWDAKVLGKAQQLEVLFPNYFAEAFGSVWLLAHPERLKLKRVRSLMDYLTKVLPNYF